MPPVPRRPFWRLPSSGELVLDVPGAPRRYVGVSHLAKDLFDHAQSHLSVRKGRRLTQAEAFDVILADAIERGCLRDMPSPP